MIYKISSYLCERLCKENIVSEEEKETYEYGFQITLANIVNLMIMLTIGTLSHSLPEMILFYLIFVSFRFYCGGYHADSYSKCFLMFGGTCMLSLVIKHVVMNYGNILILLLISLLLQGGCIYKMAPIEHKNRPFSQQAVLKQWEFVSVLLTTFILVSIFMLIEKIGGNRHDKEKQST